MLCQHLIVSHRIVTERNVETSHDTKSNDNRGPALIAWHIRKSGEKAYWDRVGAAFAHKDGEGFDLVLDALPIDGRVTLRVPSEKPDQA
jgi:hypothetical protein